MVTGCTCHDHRTFARKRLFLGERFVLLHIKKLYPGNGAESPDHEDVQAMSMMVIYKELKRNCQELAKKIFSISGRAASLPVISVMCPSDHNI